MQKLDRECLEKVATAMDEYEEFVNNSTDLMPNTKRTYLLHSRNFVRWLHGEFVPGSDVR